MTEGMHWTLPSVKKDPIFQLHSWACSGKKYQKDCILCAKCHVTLCLKCFVNFHTIPNLYDTKESLCEEYGGGNDAIMINLKADNSQLMIQ